jgi:hypothetical protein
LEHHIDRRVILSEESEFKNLYIWSLQELDADGVKISRDQIPWGYNLYFHAKELTLSDTLEIAPDYESDKSDKTAVQAKQSIRAKLTPKDTWGRGSYRDPTYSMFGTDRAISSFELHIRPLEADDEKERCTAWGFVSYTSEVDFFDQTFDDTVIFYLYVRPDRFARYAAKVAGNEVDVATLRVGGVAGFYSDWSPSISTDSIKVLCSNKEQIVEIPDGSEVAPPCLGRVLEAELFLQSVRELAAVNPEPNNDDDSLEEDVLAELLPNEATLAAQNSVNASIRTIALLASLRTAAWVIALLLLLILVT